MRAKTVSRLTFQRPLGSGAAGALALLALAATGCPAGGVRRSPLQPTVGLDGSSSDVTFLPPYVCSGSISDLNCAAPFIPSADGHVTDFGMCEWSSGSGKWCNGGGMHGSIFSFKGNGANDSNGISVNTDDASLHLTLTVSNGSYGGGGLAFEAGCVDASAFDGVQFSVSVASGSLTGCTYQMQLQTFEQRPLQQSPPGACDMNTASCYNFPSATGLPAPSTDPANPTLVMIPFSSFSAARMFPTPTELVGFQWQVNSSSGQCTVELRIDDVAFIPAAAPPTDAGAAD